MSQARARLDAAQMGSGMENQMNRRRMLVAIAGFAALAHTPLFAQDAVPVVAGDLEISGAFARASPMMAGAGAGFMTIKSNGAADTLIAFKSPACNTPELHTHINDNGMMKMRAVEKIDIPEGGAAVLEPGGLHLMFIDLVEPLKEGTEVPVTLVFEKAGEVAVTLPVKGPGAMN
jgi:copper(I)-binding protein